MLESQKIDRRTFTGMFASFVVLCPMLPAKTSDTKKKKISIKPLPDSMILESRKMYDEHGSSYSNEVANDAPHRNSVDESWEVFEFGIPIGKLTFYYNPTRGVGCSHDRSCTDYITFETFFGLIVEKEEHINFINYPKFDTRDWQDEKEVLNIAKLMLSKAKDKMEMMIEKYKQHQLAINS
jgi:hypothetical protein